ncbi:MAG: hypothetical protein AAF845_13790 [Bacteroidota bacterium]
MSPLLIPLLALLIPIVAIAASAYTKVAQLRADTDARLGEATGDLEKELAAATAERDRLRTRIEALEAIVTSEGYDLEREARRAGLTPDAGRIDTGLLDGLPEAGEPSPRRRVRE